MGCASSKPKRCRHCQSPYSPAVVTRSYSMHVHHPPQSKDDSYHLVALTSTTLGSLKLESQNGTAFHHRNDDAVEDESVVAEKSKEFSVGLIEAKTWSTMIDQKIPKIAPKTPIRTPPGEPETINTWELMEGLEDVSPFRSPIHVRSFSFDVVRDPIPVQALPLDRPKSRFQDKKEEEEENSPKKPMWLQMPDNSSEDSNSNSNSNSNTSVVTEAEFDPEIISSFRKSLEKLDHEEKNNNNNSYDIDHQKFKSEKEKLILYFTSLRGVRKTYEDCCHVRVILKSLGVRVDERDVSMHSGFKEELKQLGVFAGGLPRVFVGEKYIGGADEIRKLNEEGQLEKLLEGCERIDDFNGDLNSGCCEACGDIRFVPCETCSGSCKIYNEADEDEEKQHSNEDDGEEDFGFQRCPDCNENGLIRCPICCY